MGLALNVHMHSTHVTQLLFWRPLQAHLVLMVRRLRKRPDLLPDLRPRLDGAIQQFHRITPERNSRQTRYLVVPLRHTSLCSYLPDPLGSFFRVALRWAFAQVRHHVVDRRVLVSRTGFTYDAVRAEGRAEGAWFDQQHADVEGREFGAQTLGNG